MRLLFLSHSYLSPENCKNLAELGKHVEILAAVPSKFGGFVFGSAGSNPSGSLAGYVRAFKTFSLPRSQYLLWPPRLNLTTWKPDIVNVEYDPWCPMYWQVFLARKLARLSTAQIVCSIKNNTYTEYRGFLGFLKRRIAVMGISRVSHFLACSQVVASLYRERFLLNEKKLTVCYHLAVDTELFTPRASSQGKSEHLVIGYCGRLDPDKGVPELLDAVGYLRKGKGLSLELRLLGTGILVETLRERSRRDPWLVLEDPVPHEQVPKFLAKLDIFAFPSRVAEEHEEHDAHALAEACACGLPCLTTTSGCIPEMVGSGEALLVRPNCPEALKEGLERLCTNADFRDELGQMARKKALREWSMEAVAEKKLRVFRKLWESSTK